MLRHDKYGNQGLDKIANLEDSKAKSDLWEQLNGGDVALMPGIINIPMCGPGEIYDNWKKKTSGQSMDYAGYPCNRP